MSARTRFSILTGSGQPYERGTKAELERRRAALEAADAPGKEPEPASIEPPTYTMVVLERDGPDERISRVLLTPTTIAAEKARGEELQQLRAWMSDPGSPYHKGPDAERHQARYRSLLENQKP